jgi:hypothetical protein
MATLQPVTYYNPLIVPEILPVSGNTPFGYYDNDLKYQADATNFVKYAYRRLGGGIMDVELTEANYYACLEDAVNVYAEEVFNYKIRENYLSLEGSPTGSDEYNINTTLIQPNLATIIRLAKDYGAEAGSGGNLTYYSGSVDLIAGQQYYDLDAWASGSGAVAAGDTIEVKKVFYEAPPSIMRYFDPYAGTGTGFNNLMEQFGMGNMSPGVSFMLMPVYADVLKIQAIEFNDQVRKSAYSFELVNNKLRIFPIPAMNDKLWFTYIRESERNAAGRPSNPQNVVTNVSNVPYTNITYNQINSPGIQWIRNYALANCKETISIIRSKYSNQPFPGTEVTINGSTLETQAANEKQQLLEALRATLDDSSRQKQLEKKAAEVANMTATFNTIPMTIYVG